MRVELHVCLDESAVFKRLVGNAIRVSLMQSNTSRGVTFYFPVTSREFMSIFESELQLGHPV